MHVLASLTLLLLTIISAVGATIVQTETNFVAWEAEIGTLNDAANNGSKFDLMSPGTAGSVGDVLIARTPQNDMGNVSYTVVFSENVTYTAFVRLREPNLANPALSVPQADAAGTATIFGGDSTFQWFHLSGVDYTPGSGGNPAAGSPATITLQIEDPISPLNEYEIDAVGFVRQADRNDFGGSGNGGFLVVAVPEPSTSLLMFGGLMLLAGRRARRR